MLYGTTQFGGSNAGAGGTIFRLSLSGGDYSVLYSFKGSPRDGAEGLSLIQASNGQFYGTTQSGGAFDLGVLFTFFPTPQTPLTLHSETGIGHFSISGPASKDFVIDASSTLHLWSPLATNSLSGSGAFDFQDSAAAGQSNRFYRARIP